MEIATEMEDGDAYYQSSYGDNSTIDPDIRFSYIDEKIENLLGDCRKDFENPLTPDSLGAKFGMYGSFLPTYQRSPIVPHPKTHVSPNNIHIEVGQQNIGSKLSASKPSTNVKSKQEVPKPCADKSTCNGQPSVNKESDQKSLKVRIRVGSDNLSRSKKAEIYSGLGLDISPSSSLEASPVNSNGFFQEPQDNQIESPTSILEIMTSFPVMGKLVSPLPYDVLHLMEKEKGSQESSVTALHGSDFSKVDQDFLEDFSKLPTKTKCDEKKEVLPIKTDSDVSSGSKILDNGVMKSSKHKDMKLGPNKTSSSSSGAKKKLKDVIMDNGVKNKADMPKEDLKKKSGKVMETYKDLFGDLDLGHEDDEKIGLKKASGGNNGIIGKKEEKRVVSDAGVPMVAPLVNEDWVCCDKCEQWRLLPPGINPSNLPEKWLCSMLDWLPGMNKCSFSEEETTKAITSKLGTIPHNVHLSSKIGIKKKQEVKNLTYEVKQDRPSMSSNSSKKNLHNSYKSRSLNGTKFCPVNGIEFQDSGQSKRVVVEKEGKKQKDDNGLHQTLDEGKNNRHSEIGNKRESTQDFPKDLKKVKIGVDHGTFHMGKSDKEDVTKKRNRENEVDVAPKYVKEKSENNHMKERKLKVLKCEDEGIDARKGKKVEEVKMRSINVIDSSRKDKDKDTAMAATSSSSKVSGSQKTKINNQETKVSPVGSITSSSPRQILKNNKGVDPLKKNVNTRPYEEKSKEGRNKPQGKLSSENAKANGELKRRHHDDTSHVKVDQESKRPKKDVIAKEKSKPIPPRGQSEKIQGGNNVVLKNNKKVEGVNVNIKNQARDTRDTHKGKELDGTVVLVRELTNQATTNALREATNLKHTADRLKNTGSIIESRALYMEAALKFLHVASVFESVHKETGRHGELIQSISIYRDTAKLCEYCANEYERTKEMTTTALAYKCMEVAYMKVIFSSNTTAIKDVNELKSSLPMGPTGESPSSSASASDLDNLNCKAAIAKDVKNPKVAGNHVIAARHKPNYTRILDFAQDVNSAMEALRKSRIAFAASDLKDKAASSAIKSALDFHFHDVEGFLHRVRLAMEVING